MYLLVSILKQTQPLSDIIAGFGSCGITGSTVLNATGMGRVLMQAKAASQLSDQINKVIADLTGKTVAFNWRILLHPGLTHKTRNFIVLCYLNNFSF